MEEVMGAMREWLLRVVKVAVMMIIIIINHK